jgi:long-chain acyl-CoA synthetase
MAMATHVEQSAARAVRPGDRPYVSGGPRPARGTLTQLFLEACDAHRKPDALLYKHDGAWKAISHAVIVERVRRIAAGLGALGIARGARVAILSENRPEWLLADYGCLTAGLTDVPIYPTLPAEQIPYLLNDSGAVAIFVSTPQQAAKIGAIRAEVPQLKHVISFTAPCPEGATMTIGELEQLGARGESDATAHAWREGALNVQPDDIATLIYTSGTTGQPKGVMLTHDNIWSNCVSSAKALVVGRDDVALSFLPLSHIFERMGDYFLFRAGATIAYAESIDTVPINMAEVRPTMMMSVPRLYEKMFARIVENARAAGGLKWNIFNWARGVADRWADEKLAGREPGGLLALQYRLAQKLVFSKLKERVGGRLRFFVSGGAPLAPEINKFFYASGLVILEGYGLTETSPVISANTFEHFRIGSVGKVIEGVEVMIAPDGEILSRGPHIMKGYYNKPEATAEAIDADGWFHTGDIGVLEDGYLRITDRKKDIIVTAGGKNIAPQPIENLLKTNQYVSQVVMIGDKRKFPIVLVVPNWDQLEKWAARKNIVWTSRAQLLEMPTIRAKMERELLVKQLANAGLAKFELPKKVVLLEREFTIDDGSLTPTLKVKRRVIDQQYRALIDAAYAEAGEG